MLQAGACLKIARCLDLAPAGSSFTRNASWTLANFCKGRPTADFELIRPCIPSLTKVLIENNTEEILTDIVWAFSYASDEGGDERLSEYVNCNAVPRLIQLLGHPSVAISVPCLRTLGNILTGNDEIAEKAIEAGVLEAFHKMLDHQKKEIRKEICWSISNVTAGNPDQIQKCIDIGLISNLIKHAQQDTEEIRAEAVWAISNSTS